MSLASSYDTKTASALLELLASERANENLAGLQLSRIEGSTINHFSKVVDVGNTKRLVFRHGSTEDEEIVWHVQGVISALDLPPFYPKERTRQKAKFLRQGLRLNGLGTETFAAAIHNLKDIVTTFSRSVPTMQAPTFVDADEDGLFMDVANRYFSSRHDNRGGAPVLMTHAVDPTGSLAKMATGAFYHGEENVVQYFERLPSTRGSKKSRPGDLQEGDIVEVQLTLSAVRLQKADWKIVATLRCVALLDGRFAQTTLRNDVKFGTTSGFQPSTKLLKRRCGVDPEDSSCDMDETELTATKIRKMNIDDGEQGTFSIVPWPEGHTLPTFP